MSNSGFTERLDKDQKDPILFNRSRYEEEIEWTELHAGVGDEVPYDDIRNKYVREARFNLTCLITMAIIGLIAFGFAVFAWVL